MLDIIMTLPTVTLFMIITFICGILVGKMKEGDRWEDIAMAFCTMGTGGFKTSFKRNLWLIGNVIIAIIWQYYLDTPVFVAFTMILMFATHIYAHILHTRMDIEYKGSNALMEMYTK
ncbi:hypothetical protein D3C85_377690 [compost metagenome]